MAANTAAMAFWNDQGFQVQRLQMIKSVAIPNPTTK
jgi:ribosomal protein S18 acetylase RimI-like enzyme